MSTSQLILIAAATAFLCLAAPFAGWAASFISTYVLTLGGITTALFAIGEETPRHYGIAHSAPTMWLSDVLLMGSLVAIWAQGGRLRITLLLTGFALPAIILLLATWGNAPEQWSGLKLYVTAIVSFAVGRWLSENLTDRGAFVLVCACLVACAGQFAVTFAQSRGIMLVTTDKALQWVQQGRMVGLYAHPSILGKTMVLMFCFLLPLSARGQDITRRLSYVAIALGAVATLLTLSRANSFAIGVTVILWVILSGRANSTTSKLLIVAVAGALVAVNTDALTALHLRQLDDPVGGPRARFFETGMRQIHSAPFTGTGPNYYSEVVGQYDRFAAAGFPIHNSFLLPVAELGIPLAVVLFLPLLITVTQAARRIGRNRTLDPQSAALFSILPGLLVIAWTGWGMVSTEALPLWFMGFGFLASRTQVLGTDERRSDRSESRPKSHTPAFA